MNSRSGQGDCPIYNDHVAGRVFDKSLPRIRPGAQENDICWEGWGGSPEYVCRYECVGTLKAVWIWGSLGGKDILGLSSEHHLCPPPSSVATPAPSLLPTARPGHSLSLCHISLQLLLQTSFQLLPPLGWGVSLSPGALCRIDVARPPSSLLDPRLPPKVLMGPPTALFPARALAAQVATLSWM